MYDEMFNSKYQIFLFYISLKFLETKPKNQFIFNKLVL